MFACGDDASSAADDAGAGDEGGVRLEVAEGGALQLSAGDRTLFALAQGGPTLRTFSETAAGIGTVAFERDAEESSELAVTASNSIEGGARIEYAGGDGLTAVLEVSLDDADSTLFELTVEGGAPDSIAIPIRCDDDGSFHGFGEQYNATDQRGERFPLLVNEQGNGRTGEPGISIGDAHTTYFPMPFYIDVRGFGVLFDTARRVDVDLCATDAEVASIEVVGGERVQWRVLHGPSMLDVIRQLGDHVGRPAQPPAWAYGLWIGAQGGRDAVLAEADALEAAEIPVSALWVQDWGGLRENLDGGSGVQYVWWPDEDFYPDFAGMVASLKGRGYRFLTYINPFVVEGQGSRFEEMADMGLLVKDDDGEPYRSTLVPNLPQTDGFPDFTADGTHDYVVAALADIVERYGVDGWMADFGEWQPVDGVYDDGSDPIEARNTFPEHWQRASREALESQRPDGDWVMFARSGWSGVHGAAQIHWVGDQLTSFDELDGLPTVVPALINLGLSGQPYVTHDIAGFAKGTPSTRELYMRWTELGAFTPFMRTHEGADKEANWSWESDAETTAHFRKFALVHCALADELRTLGAEAQRSGAPILRHMMLEFPDDAMTHALSDQFMLGSDLLVAPVLEGGATTRAVYFPEGSWFDVWTGESVEGGEARMVDAPLGSPPVYARGADRTDLRDAGEVDWADCR